MATDPYHEFGIIYDEWQALYPRPFSLAMAPRIEAAVRAHGVPISVLGDLACGTGTFAHWWSRNHPSWTVYGTDRSAAMLARARIGGGQRNGRRSSETRLEAGQAASRRRRAKGGSGTGSSRARFLRSDRGTDRLRFLEQDLSHLALPEPAGLLTCLFDSLNHVTRRTQLETIFHRMHQTLHPGGLLLFDLIDDRKFPETFTGYSVEQGDRLFVGVETEYLERRGIGLGKAVFTFFRRSGRSWRRFDFRVTERRWRDAEIGSMLSAAGLRLLQRERIDPDEAAGVFVPRTFWVCRRPG